MWTAGMRIAWLAALSVAACGGGGGEVAGRPIVVATTTIVGDIVRSVAGDTVDVVTLLAPGADPHEYAPVPADVQALSRAQIVFAGGAGLEPWLPDLLDSAGATAPVHNLSHGVTLRRLNDGGSGTADPHVWFDVAHVIRFVGQVQESLVAADERNAEAYRANAEAYQAQLRELDAWIVAQVDRLPPDRRRLVTNHDTLGYFAARYGFEVLGTVFSAVGADASPSPQQVAGLIDAIRRAGVKAVFTENTLNHDLAGTIAREAGVTVVSQLYTDALGAPGSPADTYIDLMRYDVRTIVEALK